MSTLATASARTAVVYPESDGLPMADNTKQFHWIVTIKGGLDAVFRNEPNVFVAGNLFWYPVEGDNTIRVAPDIFVVFGRPKGDRGSYMQWLEDNIAPQVAFEIYSPGNRAGKLTSKFQFYEKHGIEEYYLYDPGKDFDDPQQSALKGWLRKGRELMEIPHMQGWVSPRLQVRFEVVDGELRLYGPDGQKFASYVELVEQREEAQKENDKLHERAERLAAQLKALGIEPEA